MKTSLLAFLFIVVLFSAIDSAFSQIVSKQYFSDNVYQNLETVRNVYRYGTDLFIVGQNSGTEANGYIRKVDGTGKQIWLFADSTVTISWVQVYDGDIYMSCSRKSMPKIIQFDRINGTTGKINWETQFKSFSISFCNFTQNRVIFNCIDSQYYNPGLNKEMWTHRVGFIDKTSGNIVKTAYVNQNIAASFELLYNDGKNNIYGYSYGRFDTLNPVSKLDTINLGDTIWRWHSLYKNGQVYGVAADSSGNIYANLGNQFLYRIVPKTGKTQWQMLSNDYLSNNFSANTIFGKYLYYAQQPQFSSVISLSRVNLDSGKTSWTKNLNIKQSILHWSQGYYLSGWAVDENGDIDLGFASDTMTYYRGCGAIVKISKTSANPVFYAVLSSPTVGTQYLLVNAPMILMPYNGTVNVISYPNVASKQDIADGFYSKYGNQVCLVAAISGKTGQQQYWNEYGGTLRLQSSIIKTIAMPDGKFASLMQLGRNAIIKEFDTSGNILWSKTFPSAVAIALAKNDIGQLCAVTFKYLDYNNQVSALIPVKDSSNMVVTKLDSTGKTLFAFSPSTGNTYACRMIYGTGPDFFISYKGYYGLGQFYDVLFKISGNNATAVKNVNFDYYQTASFSDFGKDSILLSPCFDGNIIDTTTLNSRHISMYDNNDAVGYEMYSNDTAIYFGSATINCYNSTLTKAYWGNYIPGNPKFPLKIIPARKNYLYAIGFTGDSLVNSTLFVTKFDMRNGKYIWTHVLESKYLHNCYLADAVSDTINGRIYLSGSAVINKISNASAAALWVLNDSGKVIDTFYDHGSFPYSNRMSDLVLESNGDLIMTGNVSQADYAAGVIYRYRYGYIPPVTGINQPVSTRNTILVFPNPFTEVVNVSGQLPETGTMTIELMEFSTGRAIRIFSIGRVPEGPFSEQINMQDLAPGIYLLKIITGKEVQYEKVVKMKSSN